MIKKSTSFGKIDRRRFLMNSMAFVGSGAVVAAGAVNPFMQISSDLQEQKKEPVIPWRIGAVAYGFEYSIGLFRSSKREGPRMDVFDFIKATRKAGGDVAQIYFSMISSLDVGELNRLKKLAADLDVMIEVHGGGAFSNSFEQTIEQASVLGSKVVGCNFGMLLRPNKIATLEEWDKHLEKCRHRLRQLVDKAASLDIIIAVENHLDFTVEELRDLVLSIDSPHVGILFDVGNTIGTLDDPLEAADILGPHVVATHYKDFAIEEDERGFRFTMVPLGTGSLQLPEITKRLLKHIRPGMGISIEMINGQQFNVSWLEDRFWVPYRNKTARQVAATLRHIRSKKIDYSEYIPEDEFNSQPHDKIVQMELDRMTRCISYLKQTFADQMKNET